jgi:S-adenosylmethionine decarboxylase
MSQLQETEALFSFGPHLMIDGYGGNPAKLNDLALVRQVLDELPERMAMTKVLPPMVQRFGDQGPNAGITGVVIIAESHIAIHTFPERGFLSADIFSCRAFEPSPALAFLTERFEIQRYATRFINRGKEYPRDLAVVQELLAQERAALQSSL